MLKASLVYLISSIIAKLSPFILLPILTIKLSSEDFSTGSIYISVMGFVSILISLGTQTIIPKFYFKLTTQGFSKVCSNVTIIILATSLLLIASLVFFSVFFNFKYVYFFILFSSIGLVFYNIYLSLLRTTSQLKRYVTFELMYTLFGFLFVFFLIYPKDSATIECWVIPIFMINASFGGAAYFLFSKKVDIDLRFSKKYFDEILDICLPLIPHSISLIVINISDRIILDKYLDSKETASYILAANLTTVMKVISDSFMKAWNPFYFKNVDNAHQIKKHKMTFISLYIICSFVFYFAITIVFGKIFSGEYILSVDLIPYLTFGYVIFVFYQLNVSVLIHLKCTAVLKYITPFSAIVNVAGNIMLIPKYGVVSAAVMTCVSYAIMALATHLVIKRNR